MNGDWRHKKAEAEEEEEAQADMAGQRRGKEEELAIFISAVVQSVRDARVGPWPFQQRWQVSRPVCPSRSARMEMRERGLNLRAPD